MARNTKGLNKYQKRAFRDGELRVSGESIQELLDLSRSENPKDRRKAANFLCPCHVRRRIDEVWEALYRMLEDPDLDVRKAAWHTLQDGGNPKDPVLDEIFQRAATAESDQGIRRQAAAYLKARTGDERLAMKLAMQSDYVSVGKCDFCGKTGVRTRQDYETEIPENGHLRFAHICEACDASK